MHKKSFLKIVTSFDSEEEVSHVLYRNVLRDALAKVLPENLLHPIEDDPDLLEDQEAVFHAELPFFTATPLAYAPGHISLFFLSAYRPNAFKFFFELISRWLIPGKRLDIVLFHVADLRIPLYGDDLLTLGEAMIYVENLKELEQIHHTLPIIQTEVRLGLHSSYYARRIQEIRGVSTNAKTATIQEDIAYLMERMPKWIDHDILTEMQYVLVMCRDDFKAARESRHLSRMISAQYIFRKSLRESVKKAPRKRHLRLKLFKTILHNKAGENLPVLGVLVGINFLEEKEVFEERHLLSAIQNYIPGAKAVELSCFANRRGDESICTLYLEIEKNHGEPWHLEEIRLLKEELPTDLKDRIEHLMHPVFMPRNEEEIMRNILSLSNQIRYLHDLPQVIITFNEQTPMNLFFTATLVKVIKQDSPSVQELLKNTRWHLEHRVDRITTVGYVRKQYPKEACVLTIQLPKSTFLRRNHSIDLNKARQVVFNELKRILGEMRDFNGGMISKQHETLCHICEQLNGIKYNDLLLENFFYSLIPDVMRTVVDSKLLTQLFLLLLESISQGFFGSENYFLNIQTEPGQVFIIVKTDDRTLRETISRSLSKLKIPPSKLASSFVTAYEMYYLGYLYISDQVAEQQAFCLAVQKGLGALHK